MALEVIKKSGEKEPFDAEKIRRSIQAAADETDLSEERKKEVVEQVVNSAIQLAEGKEEIATSEIREKILDELDKIEPSVSATWRKYEEERKGESVEERKEEEAEGELEGGELEEGEEGEELEKLE